MTPYVVMIAAPLLAYMFPVSGEKKRRISIGIFFYVLLFLMIFRSEEMGSDIVSYKYYFETYRNYGLIGVLRMSDFFRSDMEPLFMIFNWLVGKFTSSFRIYMSVVATFSIIPIWFWYKENIEMPELTLALFLAFDPLVMYVSGIRQGIAMAFVPIVYQAVKDKSKIKFIILVLAASLIHFSASAMLLMYPAYYAGINRKRIILLTGVFAAIYLMKNRLYQIVFSIVGSLIPKLKKHTSDPTETGAFAFLLLILLLIIYCYIVPSESKLDDEDVGMRNFLVLSFMIQIFSSISFLIMRFNCYYLMFVPLLIPSVTNKATVNKRVASILARCITVSLLFLFLYKGIAHRGSSGQYVPYIFMWSD